ncbi:MAG TPA: hypothetical protein VE620_04265, partial [Myxococcales bacterium]|nr:hypothetical protein [Myxococcales bacterium]
MRHVFTLAAIAATALAIGGPTTAAPDPPGKPDFTDEFDVVIQRTDAAGNAVGPPVQLHNPQGRPDFADEQAAKGIGVTAPDRTLAGRKRVTDFTWGSPSYSGCACNTSRSPQKAFSCRWGTTVPGRPGAKSPTSTTRDRVTASTRS